MINNNLYAYLNDYNNENEYIFYIRMIAEGGKTKSVGPYIYKIIDE